MSDHKLDSLTKADLVWLINQIQCDPLGASRVRRALIDLENRQEMMRIKEADRQLGIAVAANKEIARLLHPYVGQRIVDIPVNLCIQVDALQEKRDAAYKKYLKLTEVSS